MNYEALRPYATPTQARVLDALAKAGSLPKAAALLNLHKSGVFRTMERLRKAAARQGHAPEHDMKHPAAPGFEVKGTSTLYNAEGQVAAQWVKTRQADEDAKRLLTEFVEGLVERVRDTARPGPAPRGAAAKHLISAYVVGDAHIGMYAWHGETGGEDFDTSIASKDLKGAFNHLIAASPDSEVGVLVNVGDFLHANDTTSLTPASKNLLDTDGRYAQVIDRAVVIFRYAIDLMLRKHKQVWIVNARGNHDPDAAIWLNKVLAAYYHSEPRVTVVSNTQPIQVMEFGDTLVAVNHGDKMKPEQLYEALTRDHREAWGRAKHVYFYTGHWHHKRVIEIGGCRFETFNTLAPTDAWHASHGYGATREMQQITLHREFGEVGRNVCGLAMARLAA